MKVATPDPPGVFDRRDVEPATDRFKPVPEQQMPELVGDHVP